MPKHPYGTVTDPLHSTVSEMRMQRISYVLPDHNDCSFSEQPGQERPLMRLRKHNSTHSLQREGKQTPRRSRATSVDMARDVASADPVYLTISHDYETFHPQWLHLRKGDIVRLLSSSPGSQWLNVVTCDGHRVLLPTSFCQINPARNGSIRKIRRVSFDASMNVTIPPETDQTQDKREADKSLPTCSASYSKLIRRLESKGRAVVHSLRKNYSGRKRQDSKDSASETRSLAGAISTTCVLSDCSSVVEEFKKRYLGTVTVLYDFNSPSEDEISVQAGQTVMLLNKDDANWVWVRRFDGEEGFIPANYTTRPVCLGKKQMVSMIGRGTNLVTNLCFT